MAENKTRFYNWQKAVATDFVKFRKESPNLLAIKDYLCKRWGGSSVGILNKRPIRGGASPSSHTFGAALDWRYGDTVGHRHKIEVEVLPWLLLFPKRGKVSARPTSSILMLRWRRIFLRLKLDKPPHTPNRSCFIPHSAHSTTWSHS